MAIYPVDNTIQLLNNSGLMIRKQINPFAPELPITTRADPRTFYRMWCLWSVLMVKDNFVQ